MKPVLAISRPSRLPIALVRTPLRGPACKLTRNARTSALPDAPLPAGLPGAPAPGLVEVYPFIQIHMKNPVLFAFAPFPSRRYLPPLLPPREQISSSHVFFLSSLPRQPRGSGDPSPSPRGPQDPNPNPVKIAWSKTVRSLSSLPLAIQELGAIAGMSAVGTIIEQNKSLEYYQ